MSMKLAEPLAVATPATRASTGAERAIEAIYPSPGLHWVGNGFRVAGYFSSIPNAARRLDPFLLLDYHPEHSYAASATPRGVGVHPHRGFETVTIAWQGSVAHHDSAGGGGVVGPGDVQWMTAASGILHKEYHEADYTRRGGPFQMAQLWVNLPRRFKLAPPRYQALSAAGIPRVALPANAGEVRVIAGEFQGVRGSAQTFTEIRMFDVRLNAGNTADFGLPGHENTALLLMQGEASIQGSQVRQHDFVVFENSGARVRVSAISDLHFLVLSGEPIDEPIAQYGPFVMNTPDEIVQAFDDLQQGKFGRLDD